MGNPQGAVMGVIGRFARNGLHRIRARNASAAWRIYREEERPCEVRAVVVSRDELVILKNGNRTVPVIDHVHAVAIVYAHVITRIKPQPDFHKVGDSSASSAQ